MISLVVIAVAVVITTLSFLLPLAASVVVFGIQVPLPIIVVASQAAIFVLGYRMGCAGGRKATRLRF